MAFATIRRVMTVGEFIDKFVKTSQIPGALDWFEQSKEKLNKLWESFRKQDATSNSIGIIAEGIARKVSLHIARAAGGERKQVLANGRAFINEICNHAYENVVEGEAGTPPDLNPARIIRIFEQ